MIKLKNQIAFSMVEMMLLLLIASLIVAAAAPVITKRHLHLPSIVHHGSYMCYYKDGQLYEARKAGKRDQKMVAGYPRATANCVFDPPAKATIFQITAIGGGGGGGDAGYSGQKPKTYSNTEFTLSPFELTEDILINTVKVNDSDDAKNEVLGLLGSVWAFARGADSGTNGQLDWAKASLEDDVHDCPKNKIIYKPVPHEKDFETTFTLCKKPANEQAGHTYTEPETVSATITSYCDASSNNVLGYKISFNGASKKCVDSWEEDEYTCGYGDNYPMTYSCSKQVCEYVQPQYRTGTYSATITRQIPIKIPCNNPCQYAAQTGCCTGTMDSTTTETTTVQKNCAVGIEQCKIKDGYTKCENKSGFTCTNPCKNIKTGNKIAKSNERIEFAPNDVIYPADFKVDAPNVKVCSSNDNSPDTDSIKLTYNTEEPDGCDEKVILTFKKLTYTKETDEKTYARGVAPVCTTDKFTGGYNLKKYSYYSLDESVHTARDGRHVNSELTPDNTSFCEGTGECGPSVGEDYKNDYAEVKIYTNNKESKARSISAQKGASGNILERQTGTYTAFDYADDNLNHEKEITYYYDEVQADSGANGTEGSCKTNEGFENKSLLSCGANGTQHVGYCLQHHNQTGTDAELNGMYRYNDTYDINSLSSGNPGEAGEYKTIVVRKLNNINRNIVIGRGGSPAALGFGQSGAKGSATSFGDILSAEGGEGGSGSQKGGEENLETYDGTNFDYTKVQKCFTTDELKDDIDCQNWKSNPEGIKYYRNTSLVNGNIPTKKTIIGGMFSFILASINSSHDETVQALLQYAGKGGQGGGVEHFCWAGQYVLRFEGNILEKSSVFWDDNIPEGLTIPNNHKIPVGCASAYRNIPAGAGFDGALIITW